ncbi:TauD/TfdA family dioxygenase [Yinghuangia aomiensis]|uniref:TauD/TfdA family dioxygenase n=1 Tax=Yinghuangia aomiensis TaxID=676205 RepID=A0ABP9H6S9_9ACTN
MATSLTVTPLGSSFGARVRGADLRSAPSDESVDEIKALLDEHLVLVFPDQFLDDTQHLAFALAFGRPYIHPAARVMGRTEARVEHIVDSVDQPPYQDRWHTDVSWDVEPPTYGTLRACEIPPRGGDTIWVDMRAAHDALSPLMQRLIADLEAWHDMGAGRSFAGKAGEDVALRMRELYPGATHPVVDVHTGSSRRYLNVNKEFTRRILGMTPDESDGVLRVLVDHAANPNFQIRHSWTLGDLVIWDERCTQHFAVADYLPARREMARAAVRAAS